MKKQPCLNGVQAAWMAGIEKKLGHKVEIESEEDIRVLARMAVKPESPEVIVYDD